MTDATNREPFQTGPVMDGALDATLEEQLRGILSQVQSEAASNDGVDVEVLLRQRLDETGLEVDDVTFDQLVVEARRAEPEGDLEPGATLEEPD
ncbi:hypothetical protein [Gryllotalpicola ginsengisoli]|uniref:hypothetical protein n=1 Tax=Gryllotalpicola ginsengisoli TaxID=444608 RepID=UPI0003FB9E90|nr:hypothetical protein [Gryllotalpicola ginsengisoli]